MKTLIENLKRDTWIFCKNTHQLSYRAYWLIGRTREKAVFCTVCFTHSFISGAWVLRKQWYKILCFLWYRRQPHSVQCQKPKLIQMPLILRTSFNPSFHLKFLLLLAQIPLFWLPLLLAENATSKALCLIFESAQEDGITIPGKWQFSFKELSAAATIR